LVSKKGSFRKQFNHWKEIMDYFENGVPMFNGHNGLSMRCGEEGWNYFYRHRDIIFAYQLL
jgi:hypothetical protein